MAVPVPRTYVAGEFLGATIFNTDHRDTLNFLMNPPRCLAYRGSSLGLVDGAWTLIGLGSELYDPYSTAAHDTVTNNSRVHARENGLYIVHCQVRTSTLSSTIIQFQVRKNSAASDTGGTRLFLHSQSGAGGGEATELGRSMDYPLTNGDYVESFIRCDTGANPDASLNGGADATFLSLRWETNQ